MAKTQMTRGRHQDRARVAAGQDHEVRYETGKTGTSKAEAKPVGNNRKKVENKLGKG
jgi:hypothetical protein